MDRILIIDDNREMRELLSQLFFEWCYANVTAGTVEEARQAVLTEGPFNVVISDFQLPDGNGLQFLAWLRWERQDNARFLLISGKPLHEPIARYGPFVMNTEEEIEEALRDMRRGTFVK